MIVPAQAELLVHRSLVSVVPVMGKKFHKCMSNIENLTIYFGLGKTICLLHLFLRYLSDCHLFLFYYIFL